MIFGKGADFLAFFCIFCSFPFDKVFKKPIVKGKIDTKNVLRDVLPFYNIWEFLAPKRAVFLPFFLHFSKNSHFFENFAFLIELTLFKPKGADKTAKTHLLRGLRRIQESQNLPENTCF